jgi:hypothetical protein
MQLGIVILFQWSILQTKHALTFTLCFHFDKPFVGSNCQPISIMHVEYQEDYKLKMIWSIEGSILCFIFKKYTKRKQSINSKVCVQFLFFYMSAQEGEKDSN